MYVHTYTHLDACLLFQNLSVFLLHSFTLAVPAAQVHTETGGHVRVRGAGLTATTTQSPHLFLITTDTIGAETQTHVDMF